MHAASMMMSARDASDVIDPPAAPSGLTATALGPDSIRIDWTDNATNEDGFEIQRDDDGAGFPSPVTLTTETVDVVTTTFTGLVPGQQYHFRVRTFNAAGNSAWSNTANATTDPAAPDAPSNNGAVADSDSQITQTWTDESNNEDNFRAQIAEDAGFTTGVQTDATLSPGTEEKVWTGLDPETTYYTRVRAENATGNSSYSGTASATTDPTVPDPPTAPSGNDASADSTTAITQSWTDNSGDEDNFYAQRALDSGFTTGVNTNAVGPNVTSYQWTGLDPDTTYFFRVKATNSGGSSDWSGTASATTDADTVPDAPTNPSATADSTTQITHSWDAVSSPDADDYEVQIATNAIFTTGVQTDITVSTSYQWSELSEGQKYWFRVRGRNEAGNGAWSGAVSEYPKLKTPTGLVATLNENGISWTRLTWNDNSGHEQNYEIYRNGSLYDTEPADVEQYDILEPDHTGTWKVRAIHSTIPDSDFSNSDTV